MAKRSNQTLTEGQDGDLYELIKADVRGHLLNYGSWQKLSEVTGISLQTIDNFAYGVTINPQLRTITRLMEGMGHGEKLRGAYQSADPIFSAAALKRAPKAVKMRYKQRQAAKVLAKKKKG